MYDRTLTTGVTGIRGGFEGSSANNREIPRVAATPAITPIRDRMWNCQGRDADPTAIGGSAVIGVPSGRVEIRPHTSKSRSQSRAPVSADVILAKS